MAAAFRADLQVLSGPVIVNAGDFPADVILYPDQEFQEMDTEPDEGPLVEQYENAARLGDDDWLESRFEDQISGWGE